MAGCGFPTSRALVSISIARRWISSPLRDAVVAERGLPPDISLRPNQEPLMPRDYQLEAPPPPSDLAAEINSWLIRDARFLQGNKEVLEEFCVRRVLRRPTTTR